MGVPSPVGRSASSSVAARVFKSGRYYTADGAEGKDSSQNLAVADKIWYIPFLVPVVTTFDRIGVEVTTAQAASNLRLGIYSDSSGVPGARVLDAGTVASATTGAKTITISQALSAGLYWLALKSDTANVVVRSRDTASSLVGRTAIENENIAAEVEVSSSGALPATAASAPADLGNPKIMLRVA